MHPLFDIGPAERAQLRTLLPDRAIVVASAARDGVLTHGQLRAIGVSDSAITRRVERGLLHLRHRGVYAVGRADLTPKGGRRAALLRYGRTAALSHGSAAAEHDLLSARSRVDVTVAARPSRPPQASGVALRYTRYWLPGEVVCIEGLPCTSVARALADLAGDRRRGDFAKAWNAADLRLLLDVGELGDQIARGRAGAGVLRARLDRYDATPPTESILEELFVALCSSHGLPAPVCQWPLRMEDRSGRVDFVWPGERVAVEVDGRRWHAIQAAHDRDREKDLALRTAGFDPHRYSYRQVKDNAPRVADAIRRALAERGVRSSAR